ncbi:MAG: universal stress protein [Nitrososphaerales archaeon]|nr:universal stress protein [Nitrososphaerales archaeon]
MPTNGFKRILAAFDGSDDSVKAVKRACALAKEFNSTLTVLNVYTLPALAYAAPGPMPQIDFSALEAAAASKAKEVLDEAVVVAKEEGVTAKVEVQEASSVVQAIVEFAVDGRFDLIVMGTRGMSGFRKLLVGSVSNGVVSHAQCSVLVVR